VNDIHEWLELLESLHAKGFNAADGEGKTAILADLDRTPQWWEEELARVSRLTKRGQTLARFVTVYGLPERLTPTDTFALHLAQDFARGLRALDAAEASDMAEGRPGQFHTYLAAAGGDYAAAVLLSDAAVVRYVGGGR